MSFSVTPSILSFSYLVATVLFIFPIVFLMPVFVVEIFERESGGYGLLISMMGLGGLAGALAFTALGRWNRGLLLILGSFVSGTALLLMGSVPVYTAAVGFLLMLGIGDSARRVVIQSLLVEVADERYRGRVMSAYIMLQGLMPLGILPAGYAVDRFGAQPTVMILGAGMLTTAAVVLLTQKTLRRIQ